MSKDFIPDSFQNLHDWADHFHQQIAIHGPAIGWDAARVAALQTLLAGVRDAAADVLAKQSALDTATGALKAALQASLPEIRLDVNNIKSSRGYNEGIGKDLDIVTPAGTLDPATYQPELRAVAMDGHVRLNGKKHGVGSLNLYTRRRGESAWRLLAAKRQRFPYDDDAPLAAAGTPETREYRALGVDGDEEIGQPSAIVSAVYGG